MPRYRFPVKNIAAAVAVAVAVAPPVQNVVSSVDPYQTALEKHFPHILAAVQTMWGYKELNTYFRKLTIDERGGRDGFPPGVWDEINTLLRLHEDIVPEGLFLK
jgi:hypothetical protein